MGSTQSSIIVGVQGHGEIKLSLKNMSKQKSGADCLGDGERPRAPPMPPRR